MKMIALAAAGGALGSAARYMIGSAAGHFLGHGFPWATLIVNITGSFAMGVLIELAALKFNVPLELRVFLATGILGGYTTFSAFSLDFVVLYERKAYGLAMAYMGASVTLSILALFAGLYIVRMAIQ